MQPVVRSYLSTVCGKRSTLKQSVKVHGNAHIGDKCYSCNLCEKHFSSGSGLRQHMNIHRGKHKCRECGRCFGNSRVLAEHVQRHSEVKPSEYPICNEQFTTSSDLVQRILSGENPHECRVHSKAGSEDLHRHASVNTGQKPHKCHMCDRAFIYRGKLKDHMRVHTGEKPYKCRMCDKTFNLNGSLTTHMRVHTGDKPFKCATCGKAFTQSGALNTHMRVHSGDNPYSCHLCGKAFRQSQQLVVHVRVHTGEKPYKCSLCDRSFSQSCNLQTHKRHMHSNAADELKQDENVWMNCL